MSFLTNVIDRGSVPVLERMVSFTESRHRVLTENIANIDTPGYRTRQVDAAAFQRELKRASEARTGPAGPLPLRDSREFRVRADGGLELTPTVEPTENLLFHDGTNASIERQMAALAENGLTHQTATELLKTRYDGLLNAIRGRVQ